ncbi:hypothetical protein BH20BAC1_BH20BAC1_05010 [soil metagenome]
MQSGGKESEGTLKKHICIMAKLKGTLPLRYGLNCKYSENY